jgi:hypothetical protein
MILAMIPAPLRIVPLVFVPSVIVPVIDPALDPCLAYPPCLPGLPPAIRP